MTKRHSFPGLHSYRVEVWQSKKLHGRFLEALHGPDIDFNASVAWLRFGDPFGKTEGFYLRTRTGKMPKQSLRASAVSPMKTVYAEWELLTKTVLNYLWTSYCTMTGNVIAVGTIVIVLILSLLLPDITHKHNAAQDLKSMKQVLDKMSNDVKRAEVACLTVADEICYLHRTMNDNTTETSKHNLQDLSACNSNCLRLTQSEPAQIEKKVGVLRRWFLPNRNTSNKEVAIMSYVYTDSFDDTKKMEEQQLQSPSIQENVSQINNDN